MTVLRDYADALARPALPWGESTGTRYDEVISPDGTLREAWRGMAESAVALTPEQLRRVDAEITRFLDDDGVSYVMPGGRVQPWRLDPVPLVIDALSWSKLEAGLAQRAELLDAILADIYGGQKLLAAGLLPAAAIFSHSGFVRAAARTSAQAQASLFLIATDLGRDSDGEWIALGDRTQAPSGLGFARENRRVISQVLPELYREHTLHRMDPYFAALRASLLEAAPSRASSDAQVVVLSPGPLSETAYDQAFLANHLGFPLVQGSDLCVWEGDVWMKPARFPDVAPTERVDVILRRVDAPWCDPLEMRSDSRLGVVGLTEAVRRGRVTLVNGLGASVLENPALLPALPTICEELLGEQLRLPSLATWWAGDAPSRQTILDRLDDPGFRIRPIDDSWTTLRDLSRDALRERILAEPHHYVGQQLLPLSQAPVWGGAGRVDPAPVTLRTFTLRYGSTFRPLIGGMATVAEDDGQGPRTKDVWVVKGAASDPDQGLLEIEPITVSGSIPPLAPRALEDMFWAGRYSERAEDLLRTVLAIHTVADRLPRGGAEADDAVLGAMAALARLIGPRRQGILAELRAALTDSGRAGTAAQSLAQLRAAFDSVRDQLSGDIWRALGVADRALAEVRNGGGPLVDVAGRVLTGVLAVEAVTGNMIRDAGWAAIKAGRWLERALQLCYLLQTTLVEPRDRYVELSLREIILASAESQVTQRRRYRGNVRTVNVLELLLCDERNPRSVAFAVRRLTEVLPELPASSGSSRPERLLEVITQGVADADPVALASTNDGVRAGLASLLDELTAQLMQLADAIGELHFASGPAPQAITELSLTELAASA